MVFKDDRSHVLLLPEDTQFLPLWPSHILKDFPGLWAFVWCGSTGWRAHLYPYIIIVLRSGSPRRTGTEPVSVTDADRSVRLMVSPGSCWATHRCGITPSTSSPFLYFTSREICWRMVSPLLGTCWPASMQSCQCSRVLDLARPEEVPINCLTAFVATLP